MLSQPHGLAILIGTVLFSSLTTVQLSLIFLFGAFVFDFAAGIYASWVEWKNNKNKLEAYLIESKKLRKSVGKAIAYMAVISFTYVIEVIFFVKSFKIAVSDTNLTITLVAVGGCIAIEFFSVLENMKRAGFDLIAKIKSGAKSVWSVINHIKTGKDE